MVSPLEESELFLLKKEYKVLLQLSRNYQMLEHQKETP